MSKKIRTIAPLTVDSHVIPMVVDDSRIVPMSIQEMVTDTSWADGSDEINVADLGSYGTVICQNRIGELETELERERHTARRSRKALSKHAPKGEDPDAWAKSEEAKVAWSELMEATKGGEG